MEKILMKELQQYRKDYGDLLISSSEVQQERDSLRNEFENLKTKLCSYDFQIHMLNDQFAAKCRDFEAEIKILKKQNLELSQEFEHLESSKEVIEGQYEELKKESVELEELKKKNEKLMEELKREKARNEIAYNKLQNRYECVMVSARSRYKELDGRVSSLENDVAILKQGFTSSDLFQAQEDNRTTTPFVERTASSKPGSKPMIATHIQTHPESSESNARPEKSVISIPTSAKAPIVSSSIVDLASSDDDAELPSPAAHKRKLKETTNGSDKRETGSGSSRKYKKDNDIILQHCVQNVGLVSNGTGNSKKDWEYEADMLDSLEQDTELCMEGVCALSRQHMLSPREKALAKFLMDGDEEGRLKKTLAELEASYPDGAYECKRIASYHYKELFHIYKRGNDPFFSPHTISSHEANM